MTRVCRSIRAEGIQQKPVAPNARANSLESFPGALDDPSDQSESDEFEDVDELDTLGPMPVLDLGVVTGLGFSPAGDQVARRKSVFDADVLVRTEIAVVSRNDCSLYH